MTRKTGVMKIITGISEKNLTASTCGLRDPNNESNV